MSRFDLDSLRNPVSGDRPSGPLLDLGDIDYLNLNDLVEAKPPSSGGGSAPEPAWPDVAQRCCDLLTRSKDLRIAVWLTYALFKAEKVPGLCEGLSLIRDLLDKFWDDIHPELGLQGDCGDRLDVLAGLSPLRIDPYYPVNFCRQVLRIPLCSYAGRSISLRDIRIARGEIRVEDSEAGKRLELPTIEAAFRMTAPDSLKSDYAVLKRTIECLGDEVVEGLGSGIVGVFQQRSSDHKTPDFTRLREELAAAADCFREYVPGLVGDPAAHEPEPLQVQQANSVPLRPERDRVPSSPQTPMMTATSGEICSSEDVRRALDRICRYFEEHEPSSPVPLLLQRAKRLIAKDFMAVVQDLCPKGTEEVRIIGGISPETGKSDG